jgi:hypothetical protein
VYYFGGQATLIAAVLAGGLALTSTPLFAQEAATDAQSAVAELAKKLQNPIANLIIMLKQDRGWTYGLLWRTSRRAGKPSSPPRSFQFRLEKSKMEV